MPPVKPVVSRACRGASCVNNDMMARPYRAFPSKGTGLVRAHFRPFEPSFNLVILTLPSYGLHVRGRSMTRRCATLAIALAMLGLVVSYPSLRAQQNYPSGQVTFVVPLPPGGTVDIIARALAEKLQSYTGQPFVVENVTGGNTMLAAERVARAPADGATLLVATSTTLTTNPQFYRKLRYKIDDFQPVTLLAANEMIVHIRRTLPVANLPELIAYAEKTPGGISYAIL